MSNKESDPVPPENPSKCQRITRGRLNAEAQHGGSGTGGYSTQLVREVTESIGKLLEEKLATFANALEVVTTWVEDNSKRLDEAEDRVDTGGHVSYHGQQAPGSREEATDYHWVNTAYL